MNAPDGPPTQAVSDRPIVHDGVVRGPPDRAGLRWLLLVGATVFVLWISAIVWAVRQERLARTAPEERELETATA